MSNRCGYQLVEIGSDGEPTFDIDGNPIPTGDIVELGVPSWGRQIIAPKRSGIRLTTEKGRNWIFRQYEGLEAHLPFMSLPDELEVHRTLDAAVDGDRNPFLFTFDVTQSPATFYFVRKDPDFDEGTEQPVLNGTRLVSHTLSIYEEPTGTEVSL